jgi:hypothetical protein
VNASKIRFDIHHRAYALKNIQKVISSYNSLDYLISGHIDPTVMNDDVVKMTKMLDPSLWHPHYMRLHRRHEILDLDHRSCTSERSEVLLPLSQKSLSFSSWRPLYDYWSTDYCWCCLWSRTLPSPSEVCRANWSHIYT